MLQLTNICRMTLKAHTVHAANKGRSSHSDHVSETACFCDPWFSSFLNGEGSGHGEDGSNQGVFQALLLKLPPSDLPNWKRMQEKDLSPVLSDGEKHWESQKPFRIILSCPMLYSTILNSRDNNFQKACEHFINGSKPNTWPLANFSRFWRPVQW